MENIDSIFIGCDHNNGFFEIDRNKNMDTFKKDNRHDPFFDSAEIVTPEELSENPDLGGECDFICMFEFSNSKHVEIFNQLNDVYGIELICEI